MKPRGRATNELYAKISKFFGIAMNDVSRQVRGGTPIIKIYHLLNSDLSGREKKTILYDMPIKETKADMFWTKYQGDWGHDYTKTSQAMMAFKAMKSSYCNGLRNMGEFI